MSENGSQSRDESHSKRRNVLLDWQGIHSERNKCLKQKRASAKRCLTIAIDQASEALLVGNSLDEVTLKQINLDEKFHSFKTACEIYQQQMVLDEDIDECQAYYKEPEAKYLNMKDRISLRFELNLQSCYAEKNTL